MSIKIIWHFFLLFQNFVQCVLIISSLPPIPSRSALLLHSPNFMFYFFNPENPICAVYI